MRIEFKSLAFLCLKAVAVWKYLETCLSPRGVLFANIDIMRGIKWSIQFESARKVWPLLKLVAKIRGVLACSCSKNFCKRSHARIFLKIPYRVG